MGESFAARNPQEDPNGSWLDIDHFPDSPLGFENSAAEGRCSCVADIMENSGPDGTKDRLGEDGSQEKGYNNDGLEYKREDDTGVENGGEDVIANSEMDVIKFDIDNASLAEKDVWIGAGGDDRDWYHNASFALELTLPFQKSSIPLTTKSLMLKCTPLLFAQPGKVAVDLAAAELLSRHATPLGRSLRLPEMNSQGKGGSLRSRPRHGW